MQDNSRKDNVNMDITPKGDIADKSLKENGLDISVDKISIEIPKKGEPIVFTLSKDGEQVVTYKVDLSV